MRRLDEGATVLVTGGSSGLGAAVVEAVQAAGGQPIVLDRRKPSPGTAWEEVDLADGRTVERTVARIAARQPLDAVVTAAGIDSCGRLEDVPAEQWELVTRVNLFGIAAVVRAALPALTARHGRIVTVASTLAFRALSDASAYCASKFAVVGLTRSLMVELQDRVGVTLLVPGGMSTAFFDDRTPQYRPGPDAKLNAPTDVAAAVLFALQQPEGCEVRELVICQATEPTWP